MKRGRLWVDGRLQEAGEVSLSPETGALHYGTAVFEGIVAVRSRQGLVLFRAQEHMARLLNSAALLGMGLGYTQEELVGALKDTLRDQAAGRSYYVRPVVFDRNDYSRLLAKRKKVSLIILCRPFDFRLFALRMKLPVSLCIFDGLPLVFSGRFATLKASGRYVVNALAKQEGVRLGYQDSLLCDVRGNLAEATSANIFVVHKEGCLTPAPGNIIDGITRKTVISMMEQMGITVKQLALNKDMLSEAEAAFITGTASGIVAVKRIGKKTLNSRHALVRKLQDEYLGLISGRQGQVDGYLSYV